jgi:hypothetical protein
MGSPYKVVVHKYKKQQAVYNKDPIKIRIFDDNPLMQNPVEHWLVIMADEKIIDPLLIIDPNMNTIANTLAIENIGQRVISPSLIILWLSKKITNDIANADKKPIIRLEMESAKDSLTFTRSFESERTNTPIATNMAPKNTPIADNMYKTFGTDNGASSRNKTPNLKYINPSITIILIMNPEHPIIIEYLHENGFRKVMHSSLPQDALDIIQNRTAKDMIALELRIKAQDKANIEIGPNKEYKTAAVEKSTGTNSSASEPNPIRKIIQKTSAISANPLQILHNFEFVVKNLKILRVSGRGSNTSMIPFGSNSSVSLS